MRTTIRQSIRETNGTLVNNTTYSTLDPNSTPSALDGFRLSVFSLTGVNAPVPVAIVLLMTGDLSNDGLVGNENDRARGE